MVRQYQETQERINNDRHTHLLDSDSPRSDTSTCTRTQT